MSRRRRARSKSIKTVVSLFVSAACFAALALAVGTCAMWYSTANSVDPDPTVTFEVRDPRGFPEVNWEYWLTVNPQVVGWVTVPDTPVNYPIVQAPKSDPGFYLTHDVYGNRNFAGCPYLDAACADAGIEGSLNAVVFGHNLGYGDTSLFATFARYVEGDFAREHSLVLVQTPTMKIPCTVQGASCVQGERSAKRTDFADGKDFHRWYQQQLEECSYRSSTETRIDRLITFCTCSYRRWDDERTIVYTSPEACLGPITPCLPQEPFE